MPYLIARGREHDFSARVTLTIPPAGTSITLGRSADVDVQLADRSISKVHASLEVVEGARFKIVDLGSKNGLRFDGRRRAEVVVAPGQEFGIGNLVVTISGTSPETFRIPDGVPRPEPGEILGVGGEQPATDRRLVWAGAIGGVMVLAAIGWALPGWLSEPDRSDEAAVSAAKVGVDSDPPRVGEIQRPEASEPELGTLVSHADKSRGGWSALGRELDSTCGSPGCHVSSSEIDFGSSVTDAHGRWSRNLLRMKSREALPTRTPRGFVLPAFSSLAPHDAEIVLSLSDDAIDGVEVVRKKKRIHGVDAGEFPIGAISEIEAQTITRTRRAWRAAYGRDPSIGELVLSSEQSLSELVAQARLAPEFWRERARSSLRGRGEFSPGGGFEIPRTLDPASIPSNESLWAEMLELEVTRSRATTPHAYGDPPPYPEGDDSAFVGWLLERVAGRRRPDPPDRYLRSVWTVLWGAAPSFEEESLLEGIVREVPRDLDTWGRIVDALLYAPSMPFPSPPPGTERRWVAAVTRWLLARDVAELSIDAIGDALASGALDPRLVLRVCLTSNEFVQLSVTEKQFEAPVAAVDSIRVEVFAPFSVRALLAEPDRAPRLRKWCERSLVQLFPDEAISWFQLAPRAIARRDLESTTVVSHAALAGSGRHQNVIVVDGYLCHALRRLSDRIGDGRVLSPPATELDWLRGQLAVVPELSREDSELGRLAGYRFSTNRWEAAAHRPATRALLTATAAVRRSTTINVWVSLGNGVKSSSDGATSGDATAWPEFVDALEIMAGAQRNAKFDLWLWGRAPDGEVETVRMRWGPTIDRGWIQRETQPARFSHPELQFERFEGERR